jgi:CheY-like chemotaxis protein
VTQSDIGARRNAVILCAEDDPDDRLLLRDAAREIGFGPIVFVEDGEQALAYLRREGKYKDPESSPRPAVVLLDLNMPRVDGRQVLAEMKNDATLRAIPVVILTTSNADWDVAGSYASGASSFITKPVTFEGLVNVARTLNNYWFDTVRLPGDAVA